MKTAMNAAITAGVGFGKKVLFMYYLFKTIKAIATIALIVLAAVMIRRAIKRSGIVIGKIVNESDISWDERTNSDN